MAFTGWTRDDFTVFEIPGFEDRMAEIRAHLQPKLAALGEELVPRLEQETGESWFAHVAKHMRRTVNPPSDTWVAFNRIKRGYKATAHLSVGISAHGPNVVLVLKPECADKEMFANNIRRRASEIARWSSGNANLLIGDVPNASFETLTPAKSVNAAGWKTIADDLLRPNREFEAGFRLPAEPSDNRFTDLVLSRLRDLLTLYRLALP